MKPARGRGKRISARSKSVTARRKDTWTCLDCGAVSLGKPPYLNHNPGCFALEFREPY